MEKPRLGTLLPQSCCRFGGDAFAIVDLPIACLACSKSDLLRVAIDDCPLTEPVPLIGRGEPPDFLKDSWTACKRAAISSVAVRGGDQAWSLLCEVIRGRLVSISDVSSPDAE